MGAKQTKIEGSDLPDTPSSFAGFTGIDDPRSPTPNICRTPLVQLNVHPEQQTPVMLSEKPLRGLRKRFLKSFSYTLNDPRSPNAHLTRTPLVFDDALDKTLNLDDTFANLFIDSRIPQVSNGEQQTKENIVSETAENANNNSSIEIVSLECEDETQPCLSVLKQTPMQTANDPRSPSIGVERTPIIFNDKDEEAMEDEMLENILATMSLNMSSASSAVSFGSSTTEFCENLPATKLTNKHLDRVRVGKKRSLSPNKAGRAQRPRIYVDVGNNVTPQAIKIATNSTQRTPLSCVRNRSHLRSRSVEAKSQKSHLSLSSYDDNLNPVVNLSFRNVIPRSLEL